MDPTQHASAGEVARQGVFDFLRLPGEIRIEIYKEAFLPGRLGGCTGLLRVNKQVYQEALDVLYGHTIFDLVFTGLPFGGFVVGMWRTRHMIDQLCRLTIHDGPEVCALADFPAALGPNVSRIRRMRVNLPPDSFGPNGTNKNEVQYVVPIELLSRVREHCPLLTFMEAAPASLERRGIPPTLYLFDGTGPRQHFPRDYSTDTPEETKIARYTDVRHSPIALNAFFYTWHLRYFATDALHLKEINCVHLVFKINNPKWRPNWACWR